MVNMPRIYKKLPGVALFNKELGHLVLVIGKACEHVPSVFCIKPKNGYTEVGRIQLPTNKENDMLLGLVKQLKLESKILNMNVVYLKNNGHYGEIISALNKYSHLFRLGVENVKVHGVGSAKGFSSTIVEQSLHPYTISANYSDEITMFNHKNNPKECERIAQEGFQLHFYAYNVIKNIRQSNPFFRVTS